MPPTGSQSSRGLRRTSWYLTSTSPVPHQYIYNYILHYYYPHPCSAGAGGDQPPGCVPARSRLARGGAIHARQARSEQRHAAQAELAAARRGHARVSRPSWPGFPRSCPIIFYPRGVDPGGRGLRAAVYILPTPGREILHCHVRSLLWRPP